MSNTEVEPDLTNVDYEDVLHLYRGWRKSEGALKDKTKELNALKIRVKQLQESHIKFRGQIQALESVKELTVSLQTQLSTVQQENNSLVTENKELVSLNTEAENKLRSRYSAETAQTKSFRDQQIEFAMLRGRYEEQGISHRECETLAANEQAVRMASEARLQSAEGTIETLRMENRTLRMKLDSTTNRMTECDESLAQASEQLASLSREVAGIAETRDDLSTAEAEVGVLKGDIARLLRLLEHYPSAKGFLSKWRDSDGLAFMGIPNKEKEAAHRGAKALRDSGTGTGAGAPSQFSSPEDLDLNLSLISPSEVNHLKRIHGTDTFPVLSTMLEESEYWVPREAAKIGMNFMAAKIPHAPPGTIYEFLRNMNKIWLKREKRKIARIRDLYEAKVSELKRKMDMAKPYKGVMAGQQIKRLKSQVKEKTQKALSGHPKPAHDAWELEHEDWDKFEDPDTEITRIAPHERRLCSVRKSMEGHGLGNNESKSQSQPGDHDYVMRRSIDEVSAEKLLEASLISLETIGRQRATSHKNTLRDSIDSAGGSEYGNFPTESYLKGALWIGRNLTLVIEELADSLDIFRNKYLVEISSAAQDSDARRSAHRLNLLAGAGITEALSLANTSRMRARQILQGAASVVPGDTGSMKQLLSTMPIESALNRAEQAPLSPRQLHRSHAWE